MSERHKMLIELFKEDTYILDIYRFLNKLDELLNMVVFVGRDLELRDYLSEARNKLLKEFGERIYDYHE